MSAQATTFFTSPLSVTITNAGISAPTYDQVLQELQNMMINIFGNDIILDNSTQDGQMLGILAQAITDANTAMIQVFNNFSPTYAQGNGLSSVVAINGLERQPATQSTAIVTITGQAYTTINNGTIRDENGYTWALPSSVTIGGSGSIQVTATCTTQGAIQAQPNTINTIQTPTQGWYSVTNPNAANVGQAQETDTQLRQRQAKSTMLPSQTVLQGITAAILSLPNVTYCKGYENNTNQTNSDGLPPYSFSMVVAGGDTQQIANVINNKRSLGVSTFGQTSNTLPDGNVIKFQQAVTMWFYVEVDVNALTGFNENTISNIKQAIINYINNPAIGAQVWINKLKAAAEILPQNGGMEYTIQSLAMGWLPSYQPNSWPSTTTTDNAYLSYYEIPTIDDTLIKVNIVSTPS